jgi:hypothetical protein
MPLKPDDLGELVRSVAGVNRLFVHGLGVRGAAGEGGCLDSILSRTDSDY